LSGSVSFAASLASSCQRCNCFRPSEAMPSCFRGLRLSTLLK
jgi:hypothetical protein